LTSYRIYRLDGAGKIINAEWIDADSDVEALRRAEVRAQGARFELWERNRRVRRETRET